jgi:hypothetical protein
MDLRLCVFVWAFLSCVGLLLIMRLVSNMRYETAWPDPTPYDPLEFFGDRMPGTDASAYVNLYTQAGNSGSSNTFRETTHTMEHTDIRQPILSADLGPYTRVVFYAADNFEGKSALFENPHDKVLVIPSLASLPGNVSSFHLEIMHPYIIAFQEASLGGNSKIFKGNAAVLDATWTNTVSSFRLCPYGKATVFTGQGFTGTSKTFTNASSLPIDIKYVGKSMENKIASLKVEPLLALG